MNEQKEIKRTEELNASMLHYKGVKYVLATPMNRRDYNDLRGWTLPEDEDGDDEGYLVKYTDGGKPNVEGFNGYISWSPKDVFERAYQRNVTYKDALTIRLNDVHLDIQDLEYGIKHMELLGDKETELMHEELKTMKSYETLLLAHLKLIEILDLPDPSVTTDEPLRNNKQ